MEYEEHNPLPAMGAMVRILQEQLNLEMRNCDTLSKALKSAVCANPELALDPTIQAAFSMYRAINE